MQPAAGIKQQDTNHTIPTALCMQFVIQRKPHQTMSFVIAVGTTSENCITFTLNNV